MKRYLLALCALLLFAQSVFGQGLASQRDADEFANSTAVVSIDSHGQVGGDYTNGFFPSERLDVVWIDEPRFGSVQYDPENQLVLYQPSADNLDQLDDFTVYGTNANGEWNITRFFFDPTLNELVFSTDVSNSVYQGAHADRLGRASFCSFAMPGARGGFARFWGGVKLVTGLIETGGGVAVAVGTSWSGVGIVVGGGIAAHGVDTFQSGLRQLWSGEEVRTGTSILASGTAHHVFGVESRRSVVIGELVDAGVGIASGVGAITKGPQIADKFRHVFQISARARLVPAGVGGLDKTIDISADVANLIKLSGTTTAGVYAGEGGVELQKLFSQLPDEFGNAPKGSIGLGKSSNIAELGNVSIARGRGWTRDGLTRYDSDSIDEFIFAFGEATSNAKQIHFNLNGVNVRRAWLEAGELTPGVARRHGLVTEWELRQIIGNRKLLEKTTFFHNGRAISGKNYDEFYEYLLSITK